MKRNEGSGENKSWQSVGKKENEKDGSRKATSVGSVDDAV